MPLKRLADNLLVNELGFAAHSASQYTLPELTEIYNQTRVDYIVPMPMNAQRLKEYIQAYDIDLAASIVVLNDDQMIAGIAMLGVRDTRGWVTRLGVLPQQRRSGLGNFMMECLQYNALELGLTGWQLEVIKGNDPAYNLFVRTGFAVERELLVIRRPPMPIIPHAFFDAAQIIPFNHGDYAQFWTDRAPHAAWTEENSSLINGGSLQGLSIELPDGRRGRIIYQKLPFQLTHFAFDCTAYTDPELIHALLYHVHKLCPMHDTKIENVPVALWEIYQSMGYVEVFRRIEMSMPLG